MELIHFLLTYKRLKNNFLHVFMLHKIDFLRADWWQLELTLWIPIKPHLLNIMHYSWKLWKYSFTSKNKPNIDQTFVRRQVKWSNSKIGTGASLSNSNIQGSYLGSKWFFKTLANFIDSLKTSTIIDIYSLDIVHTIYIYINYSVE